MGESPKRLLSPALFLLVFLLFTLPFMTVSCGSQRLSAYNGYQLASGKGGGSAASSMMGASSSGGGAGILYLVLLLAAAGAALSFVKVTWAPLGSAACGVIGALILLGVGFMAPGVVASKSQGVATGSIQIGLWLAMLVMLAAGASAILLGQSRSGGSIGLTTSGQSSIGNAGVFRPPDSSRTAAPSFCGGCGAPAPPGTQFCGKCGAPVG